MYFIGESIRAKSAVCGGVLTWFQFFFIHKSYYVHLCYPKPACMEDNQSSSIFEMELDSYDELHLQSISKWSRFIAVTCIVLMAVFLVIFISMGQQIIEAISKLGFLGFDFDLGSLIWAIIIVVIIMAGTWFYFLLRSAILIKRGIQSKNIQEIAAGFNALKIYFIISFVISVLGILGSLTGLS
jgi:hypothetical protein